MKLMFVLLICASSTLHASANCRKNCDKNAILFYEDLGCTVTSVKNNCPSSYDCGPLVNTKETCIVRGKTFQLDEFVDSAIENPSCHGGCFCTSWNEEDDVNFVCAAIDCIEDIGPPLEPGCHWNYTAGRCCSSGQICPPFDDLSTCEYNGVIYKEGQRFEPVDSCQICVCLKGFKGRLVEPFCQRRLCGTQLNGNWYFKNGCAPLYYGKAEKFCCPGGFVCPSEGDVISDPPGVCVTDEYEKEKNGKVCGKCRISTVRKSTCKYGNKELFVGQKLRPSSYPNVECECKIPPFLTCFSF